MCSNSEVAFISRGLLSLMYCSPDGVVTLGQPDRALDATHQLSAKSARVDRAGLNLKFSHDFTLTKPHFTWNNNLTRNFRHSYI